MMSAEILLLRQANMSSFRYGFSQYLNCKILHGGDAFVEIICYSVPAIEVFFPRN